MLKFSAANAKIEALKLVSSLAQYLHKRKVYSIDLLSGHSCPFAKECLSKVVDTDEGRRIKDGPDTLFRCFSASQEVMYPAVYNLRKRNFDILRIGKNSDEISNFIRKSLPHDLGVCRIHVGGDFFNRHYMMAWAMVAELNQDKLFYSYTKSLPYWIKYRDYFDSLPNFVLTASYGGRCDHLIEQENLRFARVLSDQKSFEENTLAIDHDDSHAADPSKRFESFALNIHGTQPPGSEASKLLQQHRKNRVQHSYSRKVTA